MAQLEQEAGLLAKLRWGCCPFWRITKLFRKYNKRLQQSWLSSRFLLSQEHAPMPRYRSAAKQLNRTLYRGTR